MATKRCEKCWLEKQHSEFFRRSAAKDGLQNRCKTCQNEDRDSRVGGEKWNAARKRYLEAHRETIREYVKLKARDYYAKDPRRYHANSMRAQQSACDELRPSYVRKLAAQTIGCKPSQVPEALMLAMQAHLRIRRLLKEKQ